MCVHVHSHHSQSAHPCALPTQGNEIQVAGCAQARLLPALPDIRTSLLGLFSLGLCCVAIGLSGGVLRALWGRFLCPGDYSLIYQVPAIIRALILHSWICFLGLSCAAINLNGGVLAAIPRPAKCRRSFGRSWICFLWVFSCVSVCVCGYGRGWGCVWVRVRLWGVPLWFGLPGSWLGQISLGYNPINSPFESSMEMNHDAPEMRRGM